MAGSVGLDMFAECCLVRVVNGSNNIGDRLY